MELVREEIGVGIESIGSLLDGDAMGLTGDFLATSTISTVSLPKLTLAKSPNVISCSIDTSTWGYMKDAETFRVALGSAAEDGWSSEDDCVGDIKSSF
jgi:hypothetical protein